MGWRAKEGRAIGLSGKWEGGSYNDWNECVSMPVSLLGATDLVEEKQCFRSECFVARLVIFDQCGSWDSSIHNTVSQVHHHILFVSYLCYMLKVQSDKTLNIC